MTIIITTEKRPRVDHDTLHDLHTTRHLTGIGVGGVLLDWIRA